MKPSWLLSGPDTTGWYQAVDMDAYVERIVCTTRGWLGIERRYHVAATVYGCDLADRGPAGRHALVAAKSDTALLALEWRLKRDRTHIPARLAAAVGDFRRWSNARWNLINTYMEPIA